MWSIGDRILALWPGDREWWYPGVVCGTEDDRYEVQFDDGDRSLIEPADIARLTFPVGMLVQSRIDRDLQYIAATVLREQGAALLLRFPNDIDLWTSVALVRTARETSREWLTRN